MKTKLDSLLKSLGACHEARDWVKSEGHKTLATAWAKCPRGDWMLWLAGKLSGAPESDGRKRLVLAACECARLALPTFEERCPGDNRMRVCLDTAEKWARGEATIEQVREARRNCYAATYAADAYAAAAAYERKRILAQCADIMRKCYPKPPRQS